MSNLLTDECRERMNTLLLPMVACKYIRRTAYSTMLLLGSTAATHAATILFIGNSFTFADRSPVHYFHHERVTDLNHDGIGGMPALFKSFTLEAGVPFDVSLETSPGKNLDWHFKNRIDVIGIPWDYVVMHGFSTLDAAKPGDPGVLIDYTRRLATVFHDKNPNVDIGLMATWTRADQTYEAKGHWYGKGVDAMEKDVRAGYDQASSSTVFVKDVIPVGETWNRAIESGFADANPYDGIDSGKVDLWAYDHYHASMFGYYLEALTVFGDVTGLDPRSLGKDERCAEELGISPDQAASMEQVAFDELTIDSHRTLKSFTSIPLGVDR